MTNYKLQLHYSNHGDGAYIEGATWVTPFRKAVLTRYSTGYLDSLEKDGKLNDFLDYLEGQTTSDLYNDLDNPDHAAPTVWSFTEEFFEHVGLSPYEAARAATYGNLNWEHEYIYFDEAENLQSTSLEPDEFYDEYAESIFEHLLDDWMSK